MDNATVVEQIGRIFYIVSPNKTTFQRYRDIPMYVESATPILLSFFCLEICVSIFTKKHSVRFNDTLACLSQGLFMEFMRLFVPGGSLLVYHYVYKNYRLVTLPWDSLWTWFISFLAYDFFYYWGHRIVHEINILWSTHQVHHSSEDYNLSTNVRQSTLQYFGLWIFHLPMALFISGPAYIVHSQLSYLYQFWIHTEVIRSLGPLEYIINTPSHHRVHHGRDRNSIDKNYAGTLIIWDRLFGTFEWEKEQVHYGLTDPVNSFDFFKIQFGYCIKIWDKFWSQKGWKNKLFSLFKGPGWSPGKPRLGLIEEIPEVIGPVKKYDTQIPLWNQIYLLLHFLLVLQSHLTIMQFYKFLPSPVLYGGAFFQIFSLVSFGFLLDKRSFAPAAELLRCLLFFFLNHYFSLFILQNEIRISDFSMTSFQARWFPKDLVLMTYVLSGIWWTRFFVTERSLVAINTQLHSLNSMLRKKEKL